MARKAPKRRLDTLVVERGLAETLRKAQAMILAGEVIVEDHRVDKAGAPTREDARIRARGRRGHGYVSRGGLKLAGALDHFALDPTGWVGLDLGASTGGFTDCLLQRGAQRIYAVDVGHNLLHWKLQNDPRVINLERLHAGRLTAQNVPEAIDLVVADISFNALSRILPPAMKRLKPGALALLLVKPQFEVDREAVGEGGIVRDPAQWAIAQARVRAAVESLGLSTLGVVRSSITGTKGNVEFLLLAQAPAGQQQQ